MKSVQIAIEWFLNPDHLPFIVGIKEGLFNKYDLEVQIIEPDEHYDGLKEVKNGSIAFATNEPLHLIEQFDENFLSLGSYFATKGGVMIKESSYDKLKNGQTITVTTPVANEITNAIGFEIIKRFGAKNGFEVKKEAVEFVPNGFEHIKYLKEGADAAWLYFYNFEGIEAKHEGMDFIYMDQHSAGFANFSALDIFTSKSFYENNTQACANFDTAVKESIAFIKSNPKKAALHYYDYTQTQSDVLMDDIIDETIKCFDVAYSSSSKKALPVLEFFTDIGITTLAPATFKTAFLDA